MITKGKGKDLVSKTSGRIIEEKIIDFGDLIAKSTVGFLGRGWLYDELDKFLADKFGPRFFLVLGEPGSGKTAFMAQLVQQRGYFHHFIGKGSLFGIATSSEWHDPIRFAESVGSQLLRYYGGWVMDWESWGIEVKQDVKDLKGSTIGAEVGIYDAVPRFSDRPLLDVEQKVARFDEAARVVGVYIDKFRIDVELVIRQLISVPLKRIGEKYPEKNIVVVVDGLDEVEEHSNQKHNIVKLLPDGGLPNNVRFVVSSRYATSSTLIELIDRAKVYWLSKDLKGALDPRTMQDAEQYVLELANELTIQTELAQYNNTLFAEGKAQITKEVFTKKVAQASKGNFLYLYYYGEGLRSGDKTLLNLKNLPVGLNRIYSYFMAKIKSARGGVSWDKSYKPVLGTLAVAREPLSLTQIFEYSGVKATTVGTILTSVAQFFPAQTTEHERRYKPYHVSFGEYLISTENEDYIDAKEIHARLVRRSLRKYNQGWETCEDPYLLRHMISHIIAAEDDKLKRIEQTLAPSFVRQKRQTLRSLSGIQSDFWLALLEAEKTLDWARVIRWSWAYAGTRDRAAQMLTPQTAPLFIRMGMVNEALEIAETLDEATEDNLSDRAKVLAKIAVALAVKGRIVPDFLDKALEIVRKLPEGDNRLKAATEVAQHVALYDPQRAIEIASTYRTREPNIQLCAALAASQEYTQVALDLAANNGAALRAIALQVAPRDFARAQEIAKSIQPYDEVNAGSTFKRTSDDALADLAIWLAAHDPIHAAEMASEIKGPIEQARARIMIAGSLVQIDAPNAIELAHHNDYVATSLALANIVLMKNDSDFQAQVLEDWTKLNRQLGFNHNALVDLVSRIDLLPLRNQPIAKRIASTALLWLKDNLIESYSWINFENFEYVGDGIGQMAGACAIFDPDEALTFLDEALEKPSSHDYFRNDEARTHLAKSLARVDTGKAVQVLDRIGTQKHRTYIEVINNLAPYDFERAVAVVDAIDPAFSKTKAWLYGDLSTYLDADDRKGEQLLFGRLDKYTASQTFRIDLYLTAMEVAGQLAAIDAKKGLAFANRFRDIDIRIYNKIPYYSSLGRGLVSTDRGLAIQFAEQANLAARIEILLATLDQPRSQLPEDQAEERELIKKLHENILSATTSKGLIADKLIVKVIHILLDFGEISAWGALELAQSVHSDSTERELILYAFDKLVKEHNGNLDQLAEVLALSDDSNQRTEIFEVWFDQLTEIELRGFERKGVFRREEELDKRLNLRLELYADPKNVFARLSSGELLAPFSRVEINLHYALKALAHIHPEQFLKFYQAYTSQAVFPDLALEEYFRALAQSEPNTILRRVDSLPWQSTYERDKCLAHVADLVAERDWKQGLDVIEAIPDHILKRIAFDTILQSQALEFFLQTFDEVEEATKHFFEILQRLEITPVLPTTLQSYHNLFALMNEARHIKPDLLADILVRTAGGQHEIFLRSLPDLVRLCCSVDSALRLKLGDELEPVERLLSG